MLIAWQLLKMGRLQRMPGRLADLRESSKPGSEKQLAKYADEQLEFRKAVYRPGLCDPL